jgi:hypothetical protein
MAKICLTPHIECNNLEENFGEEKKRDFVGYRSGSSKVKAGRENQKLTTAEAFNSAAGFGENRPFYSAALADRK